MWFWMEEKALNNWIHIDQHVKQWLKEARNAILTSLQTKLAIDTKANANDLVTNVDKETEQFFVHNIHSHYPTHRIIGEEGFGDIIETLDGIVWLIDPIDGTMNFVHQKRNFFISIGIYENGVGKLGYLYDVILDELYYAIAGEGAYFNDVKLPLLQEGRIEEAIIGLNPFWIGSVSKVGNDSSKAFISLLNDVRGTRSYGSAAMELAYVASGRMDAYISMSLSPWDYAAGKIIIEELGGIVTNIAGEEINILEKSSILAARPGVHGVILDRYLKNL